MPATFDTLWPDAMYAGHTGTDSGSPAQMRPRLCWGISALIMHISAAFQPAFTLVTDSGPLRSPGTRSKKVVRFLLPLWCFYSVILRRTRLAFERTCLFWLSSAPQKTYGSPKPINTIWQSCHRIIAYPFSHPTHAYTFFFTVSFMVAMDEALIPVLVIFLGNQSRGWTKIGSWEQILRSTFTLKKKSPSLSLIKALT